MSIKLRRSFHPVGQGAFYTEEMAYNGKCKFAIVYDCGSTTCNGTNIVEDFKSKVDYIVLSHLHNDHINGVRYLRTEKDRTKILLPQLTQDGKICITIHNCLLTYELNTQDPYRTYAEVEQYLRNYGQLIHVSYSANINVKHENNEQAKGRISSELSITSEESMLLLCLDDSRYLWKYKFLNSQSADEARIVSQLKQIHEILTEGAIDEEKILSAFKRNDNIVIRKICEAYGSSAQRNQTSMVMFSGPFDPKTYKQSIDRDDPYPLLCHRSIFPADNYYKLSGCLYCGDLNLTSVKNLIKDYYQGEWDYIEIIQVPHHGAKNDFEEDFTTPPKVFFVSYGTKNHYGHPSEDVTTAIVNSGCLLFHVNEKPTTKVTYNITIKV